ncbi:cyclic peptide export ABC transporter [Corallococcus exercitus]|uniref:Cyclic peptide export ABC transporter n=1 Tax=Corallococcus exercitus TaxID=2316736 RepID=A0A7Y4KKV2_9BACT|nr:cyclic peptide export ABC transporter [Corallococcus exercitus]NOK35651.1 cyclic peptide export ABC transporter [Corallococcus exercitus]
MLSLLSLLLHRSRTSMIAIAITGIFSGLCNSALLALISHALGTDQSTLKTMLAGYVALSVGVLVGNTVPELLLAKVSRSITAELRLKLGRSILAAPYRRLEVIGKGPVLAALSQDVQAIVNIASKIPGLVVCTTIVFGCLGYMAWLSPRGMMLVLPAMGLLVVFYFFATRKMVPLWREERDTQDDLFREQQQVLDGIKELKLHGPRRREFMEEDFAPAVERVRRKGMQAAVSAALLGSFVHFFTWLVLGVMLFGVFALSAHDTDATRGYVLSLMYMWGPFRGLLEDVGRWPQVSIALDKLQQLELSLTESHPEEMAPTAPLALPADGRQEVVVESVTYAFSDSAEDAFRVGPIDLALRSGELVFVVGGNGSGKTTMAKLLTGLYAPRSGRLLWNGVPVTDQNRDAYRNTFGAIFTDFHLFENLRGVDPAHLQGRVQEYLRLFELDTKLQVVNGRFSTTSLSTGQRKRLAMVVALLEDRPFYLFDEWAADQDPEFREVFYRRLLPELAARGKGVLVITHDDRYFHLAHRVIKLELGKTVASAPASAA